ncbi:MAG: peptide-methionine (R)-S-oxide reductase MsrB [Abditibacteriaceae bacterium]
MKPISLSQFLRLSIITLACGAMLFLTQKGYSRTQRLYAENSVTSKIEYVATTSSNKSAQKNASYKRPPTNTKYQCEKITDAQWKKLLTPDQYYILRQAGTDEPFTGKLLNNHQHGIYRCAGCGQPLFTSDTKFHSGTGWPSFWQAIPGSVVAKTDNSLGMTRTEIVCSRCGGHLGHLFNDGPQPTGLRYCMDTSALTFEKK